MATLDQQRAMLAFDHVSQVSRLDEGRRKKYASMVHAMPTLLRSAGLSQALHFVASRSDENQRELLAHFAAQLRRVDGTIVGTAELLDRVRGANLSLYLRLTNEALACATWYRRFVQGMLKIEAGDSNG
jgi:CRISPR-associated protein Cmr5